MSVKFGFNFYSNHFFSGYIKFAFSIKKKKIRYPEINGDSKPSMVNNLNNLKNKTIKITIKDHRSYTGKLLSFDQNMNLVLSDTEEFRKYKKKTGGTTRYLGLCLFKGGNILDVEHNDFHDSK